MDAAKKMTMRQEAFALIRAMPAGKEKEEKFAEWKRTLFPDETKSSDAVTGGTTGGTTTTPSSSGGGGGGEEAVKQYAELIHEVSKLDPRVFNPGSLKSCSEKIARRDNWKSGDVTSFKKSLATLKKAVETAKEVNKNKVPEWDANLVRIKTLIEECFKLVESTGRVKERKYIDGYSTQYNAILAQKDQYWNGEVVKDVERVLIERLEKNKGNLKKALEKESSSSSSGSSQKRDREGDEEEEEEDKVFVIDEQWPIPETIDESLFPRIETTKSETMNRDGWRDYLKALNELDLGSYANIVQSFGQQNPALISLHTTFRAQLSQLREEIKKFCHSEPNRKYDFSKAFGYKGWMDKAVEYYRNLTEKQKKKNPPPPVASGVMKKKKKPCKQCTCVRVMFPDNLSKFCAHCFIQFVVHKDFDLYETKVARKLKHLEADVKKEYEDLSTNIAEIIDDMIENDNGKSITQEKYRTLQKMIDDCKALVPVVMKEGGEEESEYDEEEDEEEEEEKSKFISNSNLPSDESEASFTGESDEKRVKKTETTTTTVDDLAVDILHTMFRVPIKSVEDRLKKMYRGGVEKRALLVAYLADLKTVKEMFGIELTSKDSGKTVTHHIFYETEAEAETAALYMENARLTSKVVSIPLESV